MRMCDISGCNKEGRLCEIYIGWIEEGSGIGWEGDLCKGHSEDLKNFMRKGMRK